MKHFFIILLTFIFLQSCIKKKSIVELYDNAMYYEVIENLKGNDTLNYNNSLYLYKSYKQIFDNSFNWSSSVNVLDETEIQKNIPDFPKLLREFEIISNKLNKKGLLAGIYFRTGQFYKAYDLYYDIFYSSNNYYGIINDLEASLAGILLNDDFNLPNNKKLYYQTNEVLSKLDYKNISETQKKYVKSYLKIEKNSYLILSMLNNKNTLENIIKKYKLSENDLTSAYNQALETDNYSKAEIISSKLDEGYKQLLIFEKIHKKYKLGLYKDVIVQSKQINDSNNIDEISNLINIFVLYSKMKIGDYSNILNLYTNIENNSNITKFYSKNENIQSAINKKYPILRKEIIIIRKLLESLICSNRIEENEVLKIIDLPYSNKIFFNEILLKKYFIRGNYNKAYSIAQKMYKGIYYGDLLNKEDFIKTYEILKIIKERKYNKYLKNKKASILAKIKIESSDLLLKYKLYVEESNYDSDYFVRMFSNQLNDIYNSIDITSNKYVNLFDIIEKNKKLFNEKIGLLSGVKKQIYRSSNEESIFLDNISLIPTFVIDKKIVGKFLKPNRNNKLSELHYSLIFLNLLLELEKKNYSDDFIFLYFSSIYNLQSKICYQKDNNFTKLIIMYNNRKQRVVNEIFVETENSLQIEYYSTLKEKIKNSSFIDNSKTKIIY